MANIWLNIVDISTIYRRYRADLRACKIDDKSPISICPPKKSIRCADPTQHPPDSASWRQSPPYWRRSPPIHPGTKRRSAYASSRSPRVTSLSSVSGYMRMVGSVASGASACTGWSIGAQFSLLTATLGPPAPELQSPLITQPSTINWPWY